MEEDSELDECDEAADAPGGGGGGGGGGMAQPAHSSSVQEGLRRLYAEALDVCGGDASCRIGADQALDATEPVVGPPAHGVALSLARPT